MVLPIMSTVIIIQPISTFCSRICVDNFSWVIPGCPYRESVFIQQFIPIYTNLLHSKISPRIYLQTKRVAVLNV